MATALTTRQFNQAHLPLFLSGCVSISTNGGPTGHLPAPVRRSVTNMLHKRQHKGRSLEFKPDVRRQIAPGMWEM